MPKNLLKRPRDPAQLAKLMIDNASGEVEDRAPAPDDTGKMPLPSLLVALGAKKAALPGRRNSAPRSARR